MPSALKTLSVSFDDLVVGDSFTSRTRVVSDEDIMRFAALTGDWHPQHTDITFAAESSFGERIAHGMLILSFAVGLVPFDPLYVVALRRLDDVRFKRPVAIGDTIWVSGEFTALQPIDEDNGLVQCLWNVLNQDARCTMRASVGVIWRREARLAAEPATEPVE